MQGLEQRFAMASNITLKIQKIAKLQADMARDELVHP